MYLKSFSMLLDLNLAVFGNTFALTHSFGEKINKFILEKKFLKCNFHRSFSANGYKVACPTEKTLKQFRFLSSWSF